MSSGRGCAAREMKMGGLVCCEGQVRGTRPCKGFNLPCEIHPVPPMSQAMSCLADHHHDGPRTSMWRSSSLCFACRGNEQTMASSSIMLPIVTSSKPLSEHAALPCEDQSIRSRAALARTHAGKPLLSQRCKLCCRSMHALCKCRWLMLYALARRQQYPPRTPNKIHNATRPPRPHSRNHGI